MPAAAELVPDGRAVHYWDPRGVFMRIFERPLSSRRGDAEGVVMLYGPGTEWRGRFPSRPLDWVYSPQDVERLAPLVRRLLGRE